MIFLIRRREEFKDGKWDDYGRVVDDEKRGATFICLPLPDRLWLKSEYSEMPSVFHGLESRASREYFARAYRYAKLRCI